MSKYLLAFLTLIFLSGCASLQTNTVSTPVASNKKAFENEDMYILFALRAEEVGDFRSASELFDNLYVNSDKAEYMQRSIRNDLAMQEFETAIEKSDKLISKNPDDILSIRFKIVALIGLYKYIEAKNLALALVKKSQDVNDYILVSDIYVQLGDNESALKYLEGAYVKEYNEQILDKMVIILYVNLNQKKDAIAQLETHTRIHGCSKLTCSRLIGFYSDENNIEGLLYAYKKLYEMDKDKEIAEKIVQVLAYQKDYSSMITFLEGSSSDNETLLQLYASAGSYKKAQLLAEKMYKESGELYYLGQSAIYEYEAEEDKNNSTMLDAVVLKLKDVVASYKSPLYMNYLGYILIDHELDIESGMSYVEDALEVEPNSAFYLDSLAWGYFKMGQCEDAKKIMDRVVALEGGDNEEVVSHVNSIDECLKK